MIHNNELVHQFCLSWMCKQSQHASLQAISERWLEEFPKTYPPCYTTLAKSGDNKGCKIAFASDDDELQWKLTWL